MMDSTTRAELRILKRKLQAIPWDDLAYITNLTQAGRTQLVQQGTTLVTVDMTPFFRVRKWIEENRP